jgi:hypothetical protein
VVAQPVEGAERGRQAGRPNTLILTHA